MNNIRNHLLWPKFETANICTAQELRNRLEKDTFGWEYRLSNTIQILNDILLIPIHACLHNQDLPVATPQLKVYIAKHHSTALFFAK